MRLQTRKFSFEAAESLKVRDGSMAGPTDFKQNEKRRVLKRCEAHVFPASLHICDALDTSE